MKPIAHAMSAAKLFGGRWQDYIDIHAMMDSSKAAVASNHHRAVLHCDFGVKAATLMFGETILNADNVAVGVERVAAQHCIEDAGRVPALTDWTANAIRPEWLAARIRYPRFDDLRADPAGGLAARYQGERAQFEPLVAFLLTGFELEEIRPSGVRSLSALTPLTLNSFTIDLAAKIFGPYIETGRRAPVCLREAGEALAIALLGRLPSLFQAVGAIRLEPWMSGARGSIAAARARLAA